VEVPGEYSGGNRGEFQKKKSPGGLKLSQRAVGGLKGVKPFTSSWG